MRRRSAAYLSLRVTHMQSKIDVYPSGTTSLRPASRRTRDWIRIDRIFKSFTSTRFFLHGLPERKECLSDERTLRLRAAICFEQIRQRV